MWLRYLFLLSCFVLAFCDDTAISIEETLDDVEDDLLIGLDTDSQDSDESEDDDLDQKTEDDNNGSPANNENDEVEDNNNVNDEDEDDNNVNDEDEDDNNENDEAEDDNNDSPANNVNDEVEDDNNGSPDNNENDEDRAVDHTQTTTALPETTPTESRRPDILSTQKGHSTNRNGNRPAIGNESRRNKSANDKVNKTGIKSANNQTNIDASSRNTKEGSFRKKRLPPNSASPSIQLIIIVVGAILACVLITGFIRWRVRKRLNEKKLGKMSENLSIYRNRMALPKNSIMDTIYECECEDRLRAQNTADGHLADDFLEGSKQDELYCSHRFDKPPSMTSGRHYDRESYLSLSYSKPSKGDREYDRVYSSKRQSRGHKKHHSHKSRYSRHHRRKSHDNTYTQKTEPFPTTNDACVEENLDDINCSTSLLEQTETTTQAEGPATSDMPVVAAFTPAELKQSSVHHSRGIIGSFMTTWRSLSFNRDWVGRMWQEKHNVRRISDVLRSVAIASDPDSEGSPSESQTSDEDIQNQRTVATPSMQPGLLATIPDADSDCSRENVCDADVNNSADTTVVTLFHSEEVAETVPEQSGLHEQSLAERFTNRSGCDDVEAALEADTSQTSRVGSLPGFLSFSDYNEDPPEYESLLDSESYSNHSIPRSSVGHPRHHRRHRRKRPDGRERSNRHLYSRVEGVDSSHTDSPDPPIPHSHEEHTPLKSDYKTHEIPPNSSLESQANDTSTVTTPLCSSDINEDPNRSHHVFTNSPSGHTVSPGASPFVPQEGIVLEQLSDGAQIIYLPPPVLPSYHNDTPPPYHK